MKGLKLDYNIKNLSDSEKEIEIVISREELEPHFQKAYREYQKKVELPGFRKGKVPLEKIIKLYGKTIEYETLEKIADESFQKTVEEKNISFIGTPSLIDMNYKKGESVTFKIKYEIIPEFELKNYKGLEFEKLIHKVTDEEVENEIERILFYNAEKEETKTATDDYHIIQFEVQELDENNTPLIGKVLKDERAYLADKNITKEFKEALTNSSVGDVRNVKYEYEHDGHKHKQNLQLTIKKVEKVIIPKLTDEFIKKITKDKTTSVEEFRKKLRKDIEDYWEEQSKSRVLATIKEKIVSSYDFSVPNSLVEKLLDSFVAELKERYPNRTLPKNFDENKYRQENRQNAIWQAKWLIIRERIIQEEKLDVNDSDYEKYVAEGMQQTGIEHDKLLEYYKNSPGLKESILTQKINQILLNQNKINEIITDKEI